MDMYIRTVRSDQVYAAIRPEVMKKCGAMQFHDADMHQCLCSDASLEAILHAADSLAERLKRARPMSNEFHDRINAENLASIIRRFRDKATSRMLFGEN